MRVVGYVRVSTTEQADHDLSLPDQKRQIEHYCSNHGYNLLHIYEEAGASASDDKRPVLQEMMAAIEHGIIDVSAIIVLKTSRFFRNIRKALDYKMRLKVVGVRLISMDGASGCSDDEDPMAEAFEIIAATFDHLESRNIGYHTARGMRENARQGFWNGAKPPYGYRVEKHVDAKGNSKGTLKLDDAESEIVKRIYSMYTTDFIGSIEIAKRLNAERIARRGKPWTSIHVMKILHDGVYTGVYTYNKFSARLKRPRPEEQWIHIAVDRIITDEEFELAAQIQDERTPERKERRNLDGPRLFAGMLKCKHCGGQMISAGTVKKKKTHGGPQEPKNYRYYACKNRLKSGETACAGVWVGAEAFEQVVLDKILDWIFSVDHVRTVVKALRKALDERSKPLQALKRQIAEVQAAIAKYQEGFEKGLFQMEDVAERFRELGAKKRALEFEFAERSALTTFPAALTKTENVVKLQAQLREVFRTASMRVKKQYLDALIEYITFDGVKVEVKARNDGIIAILEDPAALKPESVAGVISISQKWQPVGESNPCDKTENLAS